MFILPNVADINTYHISINVLFQNTGRARRYGKRLTSDVCLVRHTPDFWTRKQKVKHAELAQTVSSKQHRFEVSVGGEGGCLY